MGRTILKRDVQAGMREILATSQIRDELVATFGRELAIGSRSDLHTITTVQKIAERGDRKRVAHILQRTRHRDVIAWGLTQPGSEYICAAARNRLLNATQLPLLAEAYRGKPRKGVLVELLKVATRLNEPLPYALAPEAGYGGLAKLYNTEIGLRTYTWMQNHQADTLAEICEMVTETMVNGEYGRYWPELDTHLISESSERQQVIDAWLAGKLNIPARSEVLRSHFEEGGFTPQTYAQAIVKLYNREMSRSGVIGWWSLPHQVLFSRPDPDGKGLQRQSLPPAYHLEAGKLLQETCGDDAGIWPTVFSILGQETPIVETATLTQKGNGYAEEARDTGTNIVLVYSGFTDEELRKSGIEPLDYDTYILNQRVQQNVKSSAPIQTVEHAQKVVRAALTAQNFNVSKEQDSTVNALQWAENCHKLNEVAGNLPVEQILGYIGSHRKTVGSLILGRWLAAPFIDDVNEWQAMLKLLESTGSELTVNELFAVFGHKASETTDTEHTEK